MYRWLVSHYPSRLVNLLYSLWYGLLLVLVIYHLDAPPARFLYLHQ
jgi:hypothetical protein